MGSCCSTEEDKNNVNISSKNTKGGAKGTAVSPAAQNQNFEFGTEKASENIMDHVNQTVATIYKEKGAFKGRVDSDDNALERRPCATLENGAKYEGQWNKSTNEREGYGKQVWADGSMYEGSWKLSKANGKGRLIHADGDTYEGEWKDDKAHGYGVYIHTDGA